MSFKEIYNQKKKIIDQKIDDHLENSILMKKVPKRLREAMSYSLLVGGKRLRPILSLLVHDLAIDWIHAQKIKISIREDYVKSIALAIEMIHTYSLIHDDLPSMDDDGLRRGKPTCHIKFGEANAILAGDAWLNQSFELLAELEHSQIRLVIALIAKAAGARGMVGGQVIDMEGTGSSMNLDELQRLHSLKTGQLIQGAVLAPVVLYGLNQLQGKLESYGKKIGLAFQVMDDFLEATEKDIEKLGKNPDSDLKNDKSTFVKLLGVEKTKSYAEELVKTAIEDIESIELESFSSKSKVNLIAVARYIVDRDH